MLCILYILFLIYCKLFEYSYTRDDIIFTYCQVCKYLILTIVNSMFSLILMTVDTFESKYHSDFKVLYTRLHVNLISHNCH